MGGTSDLHPLNLTPPAAVLDTVARGVALGGTPDAADLAWAGKMRAGNITADDIRAAGAWFAGARADATFAAARRRRSGPEYTGWLLRGGSAGEKWVTKLSAALDALDAAGVSGGVIVSAPVEPESAPRGAAVVIPLRIEEAGLMAQPTGLPAEELHLTLLYLGHAADIPPPDLDALGVALAELARRSEPFNAAVTGLARFEGDGDADAIVALASSPRIDDLRAAVVALATDVGLVSPTQHGFIPHITLGYVAPGADLGVPRSPLASFAVDYVALWRGGSRTVYPLQGMPEKGAPLPLAPTETHMTTATDPPIPPSTPELTPPVTLRGKVVQFDLGEAEPVDNEDWNRQHVVGRLRAWASSNGTGDYATLNVEQLARAFAWYDPESAARQNINAYRLPHHDVVGGKLVLTRQGLLAACRALMGGEHGIPEEDEGEVRLHLARHCAQFGMAPPWEAQRTGSTELDPTTMAAPSGTGVIDGVVSESWIQVAKVGVFKGHSAGAFEFNTAVFAKIAANFLATANRRVPVDYEHATEILNDSTLQKGAPAVGWIVELDNRGDAGLYGRVQWCDADAVGYIRSGRYRFFSPAVAFNAIHPVTGEPQGPTLVSGGLTNRPFLDGMAPVTARAEAEAAIAVVSTADSNAPAVTLTDAAADETVRAGIQARLDAASPADKAVIAASAATLAPVIEGPEPAAPPPAQDVPAVTENAASATSEIVTAPLTLSAALVAAWPSASAAGLRTLSWGGYVDDIDDLGDLRSFVGYVLGLPKIATEAEILAGLDKLAAYTVGDMGARDAVDVERIIRHLRVELNLPVLTPAPEVVGAVIRRALDLRPAPAPSAMSIGPADVHIPGVGGEQPAASTPMTAKEPPVNPEILTALGLPVGSDDAAILDAVKTLSARAEASARAAAESTVDGLVSRGLVAASGRASAVAAAMRDPEGFAGMFPAAAPAPQVASREVPKALSQTLSQPAAGQGNAAPGAPLPPPVPRSADYSTRLHAEATARMSAAAAKGQPLALRAAYEAVEADWATIRGASR